MRGAGERKRPLKLQIKSKRFEPNMLATLPPRPRLKSGKYTFLTRKFQHSKGRQQSARIGRIRGAHHLQQKT
jgi:hypothetical protein